MLFNRIKKLTRKNVTVNAATASLTEKDHGNKVVSLGIAATQTLTLPKAKGDGLTISVYMPVTATGNKVIRVIDSVDVFQGGSLALPSAGGAVNYFAAVAGTSDTLTLNGTTTGGIRGTEVVFTSVQAGVWDVEVFAVCSGTVATPFSATV